MVLLSAQSQAPGFQVGLSELYRGKMACSGPCLFGAEHCESGTLGIGVDGIKHAPAFCPLAGGRSRSPRLGAKPFWEDPCKLSRG